MQAAQGIELAENQVHSGLEDDTVIFELSPSSDRISSLDSS